MTGPSGGCLGDTNKEKTNSNHIPYHLKPILTKGGNRIEESTFFFDSPDNQAALPSNKWLRVSKQPWPLGRRFAVPLFSGPDAVRHQNSKLRSDPIWSGPIRPNPGTTNGRPVLDGRTGGGGVVPILSPGTSRNIQIEDRIHVHDVTTPNKIGPNF